MKIGIVGDIHEPFTHPMYRRFCADTFAKFKINHVHFIGDVADLHAISFHDHDPNGRSAADETELAEQGIARWQKQFERVTVSIGNHDARHFRMARKHGLPDRFIKSYRDVWKTPRWDWQFHHVFDGVLYEHGTGSSGKDAAINRAIAKRKSLVMGHVHSFPGCKYHANEFDVIFGLNVGCGIDLRAYAFAYGQDFPIRPTLGCGIVLDGEHAFFVPMPCGPKDRYHRSKAR